MKILYTPFFLILMLVVFTSACKQKVNPTFSYPITTKVDTVDFYFGHAVADPYRWLEDDMAAETKAWVNAQNNVTNSFLNSIPFRDDIKKRLADVWSYTRQNAPKLKGDYIFYSRHDGVNNHAVFYAKNIKDGIERVLINPNLFSEDGTTSLAATSISNDGKYVAYAISKGGSDWREVFIREVATGIDLNDHLKWIKFSGLSWDEEGFYYNRYDEPMTGSELSASNENQKVFYHKLGQSQSENRLVFEDPKFPQRNFSAQTDETNRYLLLSTRQSTQGNTLAIKDLKSSGKWIEADNDFTTSNSYVATVNNQIWVLTNNEAPRYRLMAINPRNAAVENWTEIIPETGDVLSAVNTTANFIIAHYIVDVESKLKVFDKKGTHLFDVELTDSGTVSGLETFTDDDKIYFNFASYTLPDKVYAYELKSRALSVEFEPDVEFDSDSFETKRVFVEAQDGAQVPLFIVHKKGMVLDGNNPALLYGYGGFNVVQMPRFDARLIPWLENGGIYISAHIRGGGEYGESWYRAGIRKNKQRVFDDFILAAEYLIKSGYTNSTKLAIMGGSNGGLLVGAVANQRPELFRVALPAVGVMDMLRYQYFTIGWAWAGDYGRSDDSEEMFKYLYAYSPLHNIPQGNIYPATMVTTADHDDRVVPAHSFKYIAALQESYSGTNPVVIRIETKAGHGAGKPISMQIDEVADRWAFTLYNMGLQYNLPTAK
ncbi:prolyl oligopeptidase family serine peptidase [Alkaliflexus imshenetskii]|uniref:prolyl oligopeptidase family serine peptidase n=1 Tax=Alkaliflexus imshenetskii TaxID=286730 RepID=UPI000479B849|nr:prolyl oligopeptidase family serine peptidase [Alkaliflexus imshenetskii]